MLFLVYINVIISHAMIFIKSFVPYQAAGISHILHISTYWGVHIHFQLIKNGRKNQNVAIVFLFSVYKHTLTLFHN